MAEEILLAELRASTKKWEEDLKRAARDADRASKEIAKGLGGIESAVKDLPKEFKKFNDELKKTEAEAQKAATATTSLNRGFGSLKSTIAGLGIVALNASLVQMASSFVESANRLQGFELQLKNITGSVASAQKEIEFVRQEASRVGVSFEAALQGFTRFSAVTAKTAIQGEGVRQVFQALNNVTAANSLTMEQYNGLLTQFGQIASKGRVQAEELTQIAENGVAAQRLLADALGVTQSQLTKMLETGKVGSEAVLLLAAQMNKELGKVAAEAATLVPARIRRIVDQSRQAITQFVKDILDSKEVKGLIDTFELFSGVGSSGLRLSFLSEAKKQIQDINDSLRIAAGVLQLIDVIGRGIEQTLRRWKEAIHEFAADLRDKALSLVESAASKILPDSVLDGLRALIDKLKDTASSVKEAVGATEVNPNQTIFGAFNAFLNNPNLDNIQGLTKKLADAFGIKNYDLLVPEKVKPAAKDSANAVSAEYQKMLDDLKSKFKNIAGAPTKEEIAYLERVREDARNALLKVLTDFNSRIEKEADEALEIYNKALKDKKPVLDPIIGDDTEERLKKFEKIFERAADNIQDTFADLFSDTLQGDLPRIQDFADSVQSIFANMAAAIVTEQLIKPLLQDAVTSAKEAFGKDGAIGKLLGEDATAHLGTIAGGAGLGLAAGSTASRVLGPSRGGTIASGAVGGAVAGAYIGSAYPGIGTVIGAVAGAIIGAAGGIFASAGQGDKKSTAFLASLSRTDQFSPQSHLEDNATQLTPFSLVGLRDIGTQKIESGAVLAAVAELDRSFARVLPEYMRKQIEAVFANVDYSARAGGEGDVVAKILQQRAFDALDAILGPDVAANVVGARGTGSASGIQAVQRRLSEALGIIRTIEEFKVGDLTDVGQAIKAIEDQFNDLMISAEAFGIGTAQIVAERDRLLAKVTSDVNADIDQLYLELTDPIAAQFAELEKQQQEQLKRAQEAGANVAKLEEAQVIQRQKLAEELADANDDVNESIDDTASRLEALRPQLDAFIRAGLSPTAQQLAALQERFAALRDEALALQQPLGELIRAYHDQGQELRGQAIFNIRQALFGITDPLTAALLQIQNQARQFQKEADAGIISQSLVDQFEAAARAQAIAQNALNVAGGGGKSAIEQMAQVFDDFVRAGNPLTQAGQALFDLTENFLNLKDAASLLGLSSADLERSYIDQAKSIREGIIAEIDASLQSRRDLVDQAAAFINQLKVGDELPSNLRLDAATQQFRDAASAGDISAAIQAGETLRTIARDAFGSTSDFFSVRNDIISTIEGLRQQEQAAIEAERARLIREETRQLEVLNIQRSSLDSLQRIQSSNSDVARSNDLILRELRGTREDYQRIESLLRQVVQG